MQLWFYSVARRAPGARCGYGVHTAGIGLRAGTSSAQEARRARVRAARIPDQRRDYMLVLKYYVNRVGTYLGSDLIELRLTWREMCVTCARFNDLTRPTATTQLNL